MSQSRSRSLTFRDAATFCILAAIGGCNSYEGPFPAVANPPPFDYIDGEELRSGMHELAYQLQQLDMTLMTAYIDEPSFQRDIVDKIRNIERIAGHLVETDLSVRHPFLMDDMDRFLSDVNRARIDAERGIPRYYMTGRISGGCITCHKGTWGH